MLKNIDPSKGNKNLFEIFNTKFGNIDLKMNDLLQ